MVYFTRDNIQVVVKVVAVHKNKALVVWEEHGQQKAKSVVCVLIFSCFTLAVFLFIFYKCYKKFFTGTSIAEHVNQHHPNQNNNDAQTHTSFNFRQAAPIIMKNHRQEEYRLFSSDLPMTTFTTASKPNTARIPKSPTITWSK